MYYQLLFVIFILIAILVTYSNSHCYIKSNIDNRYYKVKNNSLKQESADLLARINSNLVLLVEKTKDTNPNLLNFNPDNTAENVLNFDTTYTLDKGKYMAFCLGPRDEFTPRLYDINTLMYVAIHELAHIASTSIGHNDEFKKNFAYLLNEAILLKIYTYVDYSKEPVDYCGINLSRNILN